MSLLPMLTDTLLALLLGGMIFFPLVVAPTVFVVLEDEPAGRFLRALFPRYYLYLIVLSGLLAAAFMLSSLWLSATFAAITLSTLWVRQRLMPRINRARDQMLQGDRHAQRLFARGHRLSVSINMLQLLVIVAWWVQLRWPVSL